MIKSVIFDMDGVIIDTHRCAYAVLSDYAKVYGVNIAVDEIMTWGSLSVRQFWSKVKKDFGLKQSVNELVASYDYEREMSYYERIGLMPGIVELFELITNNGLSIGLVTSAEKIRIDRVLGLGDLSRHISSIVSAWDVTNHKPDPECYIKSCANMQLSPSQCLVIEDSSNGAIAAKKAGCMVAAYHGSMWIHDPFDADMHIKDFRDIKSIDQLIAQQGAAADADKTRR